MIYNHALLALYGTFSLANAQNGTEQTPTFGDVIGVLGNVGSS
jgi:hypothetical protein